MNQVRHLEVKSIIAKREAEMFSHLEDKAAKPDTHTKETLWAVVVVVLLWCVFISSQMWELVSLVDTL